MKNRCKVLKTTYKVDEANKTVVCIVKWDMQAEKSPIPYWLFTEAKCTAALMENTSVGISKCHPDDTFDIIKGKHIAESKAKAKMYRTAAKAYLKSMQYLDKTWINDLFHRKDACIKAYFGEMDHIEELGQ